MSCHLKRPGLFLVTLQPARCSLVHGQAPWQYFCTMTLLGSARRGGYPLGYPQHPWARSRCSLRGAAGSRRCAWCASQETSYKGGRLRHRVLMLSSMPSTLGGCGAVASQGAARTGDCLLAATLAAFIPSSCSSSPPPTRSCKHSRPAPST